MSLTTVQVRISLPFFLRLEGPLSVDYEGMCKESQVADLIGQRVNIAFSRSLSGARDNLDEPRVGTIVTIEVTVTGTLSDEATGQFALRNCLEIVNRVIASYQATTGEMSNSGYIFPLGTSDIQLFADIRVNGRDLRDRWPFRNVNTFPLSDGAVREFELYFTGKSELPLPKLFFVYSLTSLERGQYSMAVFQGAAAVDLRLTEIVRKRLKDAGWSDAAIHPYEQMTLGGKLAIALTDPRSLETYYHAVPGFRSLFERVKTELVPLRNRVAHRGHLATHDEGTRAVTIARDFLQVIT